MRQQLFADDERDLITVEPAGRRKLQPPIAIVLADDRRCILAPVHEILDLRL